MSANVYETEAGEADAGLRLDVFLAGEIEDASRSFVQRLIKEGRVAINGQPATRPSRAVATGDLVRAEIPPPPQTALEPEAIPLDIRYEDDHVLVINKPQGLVVHPAPGNERGTLINAVLHHCPGFQRPGDDPTRPGVVHRLDKDTSGIMVVAKSPKAFQALSQQAREHTFDRRYLALVQGNFPDDSAVIDAPLGRSMADRTRMSVTGVGGRDAVTRVTVLERFGGASFVALQLETGRTHQIRVHLRFTGHGVLGDSVYGVADFSKWRIPAPVREALEKLPGQALHAERLGFAHPVTGEFMTFTAPMPGVMVDALEALRAHGA